MSIERIEVGRERGVLNKPYGHKILYQQKNHEKKKLWFCLIYLWFYVTVNECDGT